MLLVREIGAKHTNGALAAMPPRNMVSKARRGNAEVQAHEAPDKKRKDV